jgi:hypothetical protein
MLRVAHRVSPCFLARVGQESLGGFRAVVWLMTDINEDMAVLQPGAVRGQPSGTAR